MTDKLKLLLGITGEDRDDILSFALETVTDMALGYCNLDELPPQLENTVVRMAADLYRSEGYGQAAVPQVAQSVTRGGKPLTQNPLSLWIGDFFVALF